MNLRRFETLSLYTLGGGGQLRSERRNNGIRGQNSDDAVGGGNVEKRFLWPVPTMRCGNRGSINAAVRSLVKGNGN